MTQIDTVLVMGEHGVFIWPAYALTAVVMVGFAVSSLRRLRRERKTLQQLETDTPGRPGRSRGVTR